MALGRNLRTEPVGLVRDQIERYESSNGTEGTVPRRQALRDPVDTRPHAGTVRKSALMQVTDDRATTRVRRWRRAQAPGLVPNLVADPVDGRRAPTWSPGRVRRTVRGESRRRRR